MSKPSGQPCEQSPDSRPPLTIFLCSEFPDEWSKNVNLPANLLGVNNSYFNCSTGKWLMLKALQKLKYKHGE